MPHSPQAGSPKAGARDGTVGATRRADGALAGQPTQPGETGPGEKAPRGTGTGPSQTSPGGQPDHHKRGLRRAAGPQRPLTRSQRLAITVSVALVAASGGLVAAGAGDVARFVVAALALAALAGLVGESLEQLGRRLRPGPTGLIQASLGNLPELLVAIFALRQGLTQVVQAALIGSVLANLLLVLGIAFLTGAGRHGTQSFGPEAPRMSVALLTLAVGSLAVPTLAVKLHNPAEHHTAGLSAAAAVVLLLVYVASIPFWLSREAPDPASPPRSHPAHLARARRGPWPLWLAVALLAAAAGASAAVSDWFASALEPATKSLGISPAFTGLVIVAIASNAVENAAAVRFAWRARPDYAISATLNSPLQIALLLTPLLVLISPALGPAHLLLVFPPLLVAALAIATVAVGIVIYDGEYSWLEGVSLIALYAIVASALWWG
jgi:Ca2+:H+ antiporter